MAKRTASSGQDDDESSQDPKLGKRVWEPTSEVSFERPIDGLSGRRGDEVYYRRGKKTIFRPYHGQRDPRTNDQLAKRGYMGQAQRNWQHVPAGERAAWQKFALEHVFSEAEKIGRPLGLAGFNAYVRAQTYRLGQGLDLGMTAPAWPVPGAIAELEEVAPPDPGAFAFRLKHDMKQIAGHTVLFEISPAMPTLKRKPRTQDLRWAGLSDPDSFVPLGPDGAIYLLPTARFVVEPGRIFGARARIISPDGLPGPKFMVTLLRKAPDPENWETAAASG